MSASRSVEEKNYITLKEMRGYIYNRTSLFEHRALCLGLRIFALQQPSMNDLNSRGMLC